MFLVSYQCFRVCPPQKLRNINIMFPTNVSLFLHLRNIVTERCFLLIFYENIIFPNVPLFIYIGKHCYRNTMFLSMFYRNFIFSINVSLFVPYQESSENIDRNNVSAITFPDLPKLRMKNIYILESVWGGGGKCYSLTKYLL